MKPISLSLLTVATALSLGIPAKPQADELPTDKPSENEMDLASLFPLTGRGNEPGWALTFDRSRMVFVMADTQSPVEVSLPEMETIEGGWRFTDSEADIAVVMMPELCRDTMTGMPSPFRMTVTTAGQMLSGCAGTPVSLLAGAGWEIRKIEGRNVPREIQISMEFDAATSSVSGASGCNRYFGGFTVSGEGLGFSEQMAGSMMACEDGAMSLEKSFLAALTKVDSFDFDAQGHLVLLSGGEPVIQATR